MASQANNKHARVGAGDLLVASVVVVLVAAPLLFTSSGFAGDFTNHLWLIWAAGHALAQAGHPSYFLNASGAGVFDPWFAFYGGSLYMLVGAISALCGGHPIVAYVGVITLAVAGSYLGMLWLARELGLRGLKSHVPALVVVTSAYYITTLYGRGAWPEFMATTAIAPLLASGVHLARSARWRPGPILAFVVSAVIFTGSHNITLLWGSLIAAGSGVTLWLALGRPRQLPARRLRMLAGLGVVSVGINAWYLVPDFAYAADTRAYINAVPYAAYSFFDTPQVLFDPLRTVPAASSTPALFVQIPVWFLAWGLLAGVMLLARRGPRDALRRVWIGILVVLGALLGTLMFTPIWSYMPFPFDSIQYPYRLGTYIYYAVSWLVLAATLGLQRASAERAACRVTGGLRLALAGTCAVSIGLCVWQQWVPNTRTTASYANRRQALADMDAVPRTWPGLAQHEPSFYDDNAARVVAVPGNRSLTIAPRQVRGDHFSAWMQVPAGLAPIQTNISGGSYIVQISGLTRIGRNQAGFAVVRRTRPGDGPVHVTVQTARSAPIVLGWALSLGAFLTILAILARACQIAYEARSV
jgi:hypothetical protein